MRGARAIVSRWTVDGRRTRRGAEVGGSRTSSHSAQLYCYWRKMLYV